uniref:Uncharacterized protein n=1 Tax=Brassica campestris TaxID=3711 RepID=M4EJW6_BRACM
MSSEVRRYIPTNFRRLQRLYVLSECRRKVVGIFRRAIFPLKFVGNGRRNSDDFKFFVFVGNWSEIRHKRPTNFNPSEPPSEFGVFSCSDVSKDDDGLCLEFGVNAFADEIVIDSLVVQQPHEPKYPYQGPDFDDLDENLQRAVHKFLEIRGINLTLTNFWADYMVNKDKRSHLQWLKDVKSFVLTSENSQ